MRRVLVTGATGGLGGRVLPLLGGYEVTALSRRDQPGRDGVRWIRGDVVRGVGLAAAVDRADAVLHLAGSARGDDVAARGVAAAAAAAGVGHIVMISVVGADRMPIGYFRAKAAAESALAASGVPWTVLRAAQFHTLVERAARAMSAGPIALAPRGLRFEPVDPGEVAARLVELVGGPPGGRVPDLAGPEVLDADAMVRSMMAATGRRRPVAHPGLPGAIGAAYRAGDNLADDTAVRGRRTWHEHLRAVSSDVAHRQ